MSEVLDAPARATAERAAAGLRTLVLVGNANVGKSALFGALTGKYATVSNYPGTTVEVMRGALSARGANFSVLDTPGTSGLFPGGEDEQATRDILLGEPGATVVQVCDAKNLRRGLLLALELAEAQVPAVLALNMADEAWERGIAIDVALLEQLLGIPVVPTVAVQRQGLRALREALARARPATLEARYDPALEQALSDAQPLLPRDLGLAPRALAMLALLGDASLRSWLRPRISEAALRRLDDLAQRAARDLGPLRIRVAQARLQVVDILLARVLHLVLPPGPTRGAAWIDRLTTHRWLGLPLLAAVLYACYQFVGVFGAKVCVDFLERAVFAERLTPWVAGALRWSDFLAGPDGLIAGRYGLFSMGLSYGLAIILPIVATFFLAFSALEDSGYLPRLSVMADRALRAIGLNGKAVLPMVLGLGCDTMATMTARVLETKKERVLVTLLLALGVPCSAQLAVIFAMLAGVSAAASLWFAGTILAVIFVVGWLAAKVIPGSRSDFVVELPPLRLPQPANVLVKTVARIEWYLREALPLFLVGTLLLWGLDRAGALAALERAAAPLVVGLLDLPREAAGAFIAGFLRRDYAAAGLFAHWQPLMRAGAMTRGMEIQVVVALTTITLFIPCIANFLVIIKERGWRTAMAMLAFILPVAFGTGAAVNALMRRFY